MTATTYEELNSKFATLLCDYDSARDELQQEREKNRKLHLAIGRARELLRDSAAPFDTACTILGEIEL